MKPPWWLSWSWLPSLSTNALAFGAASFSSSVLCTLYSLYVTDVFTSVYKVGGFMNFFTLIPQI